MCDRHPSHMSRGRICLNIKLPFIWNMQLPDHDHCKYCGDPIRYGDEFCDDYCKELFKAQEREDRNKDLRFYGLIAGSLGALFIVGILIKLFL